MWSWTAFFDFLTSVDLLRGAWTTIWLTVVTMVVGLVLGLLLAVMKSSRLRPLAYFANFYIWLFRGTPLLVQLVIIYTGLPQLGVTLNPIMSALLGLSLNEAAYLSEVVRAGIMSVPQGQFEAARALGMVPGKVMRVVVLPQAFRVMIPPLGNSLNGLLKTTTLVSIISVEELLRLTQYAVQVNFRVLEGLVAAACYYLVMTSVWSLIQGRIEALVGRGHGNSSVRPTPAGGSTVTPELAGETR